MLPLLYARPALQPLSELGAQRRGIAGIVRAAEAEPTELTTPQP